MKTIILIAATVSMCNYVSAQLPTSSFTNNNVRIDSMLKATYSDTLPGASIAVMKNGRMIFQGNYGVANTHTKEKVTASSNFNIASLTKQFTALAILELAEKHRLTLNDKLSHFFPGMNKKVANVITVKQLLTHSSGIIDHYSYANTGNRKHAYNADVYNAIKNLDSTYFIPGTQFRYSNTAYCLLGLIIEKLSGQPYNSYMKQHIFKTAGMINTTTWNENEHISNEVTGYERDSTNAGFKVSGAGTSVFFSTEADGGVYTSTTDYLSWYKSLQSGKTFPGDIVEQSRTIQHFISKESKLGYGYGWFIDENNNTHKVYHSGSNNGFRSYSFTLPREDYLIIIFSNRDDVDLETIVQKIVQLQWSNNLSFTKIEVLTS